MWTLLHAYNFCCDRLKALLWVKHFESFPWLLLFQILQTHLRHSSCQKCYLFFSFFSKIKQMYILGKTHWIKILVANLKSPLPTTTAKSGNGGRCFPGKRYLAFTSNRTTPRPLRILNRWRNPRIKGEIRSLYDTDAKKGRPINLDSQQWEVIQHLRRNDDLIVCETDKNLGPADREERVHKTRPQGSPQRCEHVPPSQRASGTKSSTEDPIQSRDWLYDLNGGSCVAWCSRSLS